MRFYASERDRLNRGFGPFFNLFFCALGIGSWRAITFPIQHQLISPVTYPVECRGAEQFVREGLAPFAEIQVAGDDRGGPLITFANQVVEVFVLPRLEGFESKVIND